MNTPYIAELFSLKGLSRLASRDRNHCNGDALFVDWPSRYSGLRS